MEKSFNGLRELMIEEQFVKGCSPALRVFLKERNCRTIQELSQAADKFVEAQSLLNFGRERPEKEAAQGSGLRAEQTKKTPRGDIRGFLCDKGHRAAECFSRTKSNYRDQGRTGDKLRLNREKFASTREASCMVSVDKAEGTTDHGDYVVLQD